MKHQLLEEERGSLTGLTQPGETLRDISEEGQPTYILNELGTGSNVLIILKTSLLLLCQTYVTFLFLMSDTRQLRALVKVMDQTCKKPPVLVGMEQITFSIVCSSSTLVYGPDVASFASSPRGILFFWPNKRCA